MALASVYQRWVVETGKQPDLFLLLAFLLTFGFIRTSAHLIRAQVKWWPGNVSVGGTHVHHLVWGILLLLGTGYVAIAIRPGGPGPEILAVLFGVGAGLTLDEFALWLNLEDVYWSAKGRESIDAVIIAGGLGGLVLVGLRAWLEVAGDVEVAARAAIGSALVLHLLISVVNAAKGKYASAALGIVLPFVGPVAALRLARPRSLWARQYGPDKLARAAARYGEGVPAPVSQPSV